METVVNTLTIEELEAALAEKKKEARNKKLIERQAYEARRDELVDMVIARAKILFDQNRDFKQWTMELIETFKTEAKEYGDITKKSKGGFSLRSSVSQALVSLDRNVVSEYDERAAMAEELIKEFLSNTVKKADKVTYRTISALMERNKQGDYTPGRIASLLKIRDNYDDKRWQKAMDLFAESFRIRDISYSVSFFTKDDMGKDKPIVLSFAGIPVNFKTEKEEVEPKQQKA